MICAYMAMMMKVLLNFDEFWWIVLVYVRILSDAFKFNCHMIISSFAFFQAVGDGLFWGYHRTPSLRAYIVHRSVLEKSMTRLPNSLSVKAHVPPPGKIAQTVQSNFTTSFFMFTLVHQEMIQRKWTYVSSKLKPLWVENTVVTPSELTTCYFWICLEHQSVEDPNLTHFHKIRGYSPHGRARRFSRDSLEFQAISWIQETNGVSLKFGYMEPFKTPNHQITQVCFCFETSRCLVK